MTVIGGARNPAARPATAAHRAVRIRRLLVTTGLMCATTLLLLHATRHMDAIVWPVSLWRPRMRSASDERHRSGAAGRRRRSGARHQPTGSSPVLRKLAADTTAPSVLNVHMIPHTHDDVGWRKTPEQYFEAHRNDSIDTRGDVRNIITSAVQALLENDARTFVYVEMKYFAMWWREQSDAVRDAVRYLVANRQLSFANGGHCMHDEAATHFIGMLDQTTLGHAFLRRELGVVPTVGWQLDPFGHSATQASLLTARAGLDALYFGRIDHQDLRLRRASRDCEGLWNASRSFPDATVFWGLTGSYQGNYGPPDGFWFDVLTSDNEPLVGANETRQFQRVLEFLQDLQVQANQTKGRHIMVTLGSDFHYRAAHYNFQNYDALISLIMTYQQWGLVDVPAIFGPRFRRVNVFYSSPEYYTQMKYMESSANVTAAAAGSAQPIVWSVKRDDFFPYSDCPHCFWTGYFTSRTAFKRFERVASGFLLAARQIETKALARASAPRRAGLAALEDALGVVQHHDAVSGTAMQHVADDYSQRLQAGLNEASAYVTKALKEIMLIDPDNDLIDMTYCQLLNETICEVSERATESDTRALTVIIYNPCASEHSSIVRLPVASASDFQIERIGRGSDKVSVRSYEDPIVYFGDAAKYILFFDTGPLPPTGAAAFRIVKSSGRIGPNENESPLSAASRQLNKEKSVILSNEFLSVQFDRRTGMMEHVTAGDAKLDIEQSWGYYQSFDASKDESDSKQNSGAYIFRPSNATQDLIRVIPAQGKAMFRNTSVGAEVHVFFEEPWVSQVTRIFYGQPFVEIEYTVGPVPIDDDRGKEIVTRWKASIKNGDTFYTDSNGREFMQRRRNHRPSWKLETYQPVAGNYYPVNAAIFIQDDAASLSVLTDRSQGGTSLGAGEIELMVQRRTLVDDGRGVDEPLNETIGGMNAYPPYGDATRVGHGVVIRGTHRLLIGKGNEGASLSRSVMDTLFAQPLVFVGSSASDHPPSFREPSFALLSKALPANVMLITISKQEEDEVDRQTYLLRFGHQYGVDDDPKLSLPVQVDLATLFLDYEIISVVEMTLSGNQEWKSYMKRKLEWAPDTGSWRGTGELSASDDVRVITLHPMDVRTFSVVLAPK